MINKFGYLLFLFMEGFTVVGIPYYIFFTWGDWNTVKNRFSKRANLTMSIIGIIILLSIEIVLIPDTINYCRDIPSFLTKNYKVETGIISERIQERGYAIIYVNNIRLKGTVDYKDIERYDFFEFYYLPNTHRIIAYKGIK